MECREIEYRNISMLLEEAEKTLAPSQLELVAEIVSSFEKIVIQADKEKG